MVSEAVAGQNTHVKLSLDSEEDIDTDTTPREMGLELVQTEGRTLYSAMDDASRPIVDEVRGNGFFIDPQTLQIIFEKTAWNRGFGAYNEVPGANRPSFTIGVDHTRQHPILAPKQYWAGVGSGQADFPSGITAFTEFKDVHYVTAAEKIYKMEGWGTPYFTAVKTHTNGNATFRDLFAFNGWLYAAAGTGYAYAFSTDGATWYESTRAGALGQAEQFFELNGYLSKTLTPNEHYRTGDGRNIGGGGDGGGVAWSTADYIGDSSHTIQQMLAQSSSLVFATDRGLFTLDSFGNALPLWPSLRTQQDDGNGWHSINWDNALFYPTLRGGLFTLSEGRPYDIAPSLQQLEPLRLPDHLRCVHVRERVDSERNILK